MIERMFDDGAVGSTQVQVFELANPHRFLFGSEKKVAELVEHDTIKTQ